LYEKTCDAREAAYGGVLEVGVGRAVGVAAGHLLDPQHQVEARRGLRQAAHAEQRARRTRLSIHFLAIALRDAQLLRPAKKI
jgi:hypothetical protein